MKKNYDNENFMDKVNMWTGFYRANPHRFVKDYLGIKLKLFQIFLIYAMNKYYYFMYFAARGQGKSFIISIYAVCRCILYPGTAIVIASGTVDQAGRIIEQYITKMRNQSPNLAREIKKINTNKDDTSVEFHNGSIIRAVVSGDSGRGWRCNILICEEFRLIKKHVLDKVLRRFISTERKPKYMDNPLYSHLEEPNKEIYISSAYYKNHWCYSKFMSFIKKMSTDRDYFVCGLPYELSIAEGLLSQKAVDNEKTEEDFNEIDWLMEMGCVFWGESEKAFYKLDHLTLNRTNTIKPFYPLSNLEYISNKSNKKSRDEYKSRIKKMNGEIRIISVDVAMMGGNNNDNTIFTCFRLIPKENRFIRFVPYIDSLNGQHSETQAIHLKRLYDDFEADYVIMDTQGNGLSLYDDCAKVLYDSDRDTEYPAWCASNNEEMKNRALDKNALPLIYSMKASNQKMNHEIAMKLRDNLEKGNIKFLANEIEGKEYLIDKMKFDTLDLEERSKLLRPYIQTTALVNESVNLEYEIKNGFVKIYEVGTNRKDRWSSLAYGSYYADLLEQGLNTNGELDEEDLYVVLM
ncbi:hypothetical protein BSK66_26710 [Paenibacillus odorifer]|uniref:terminase large subunit domain-containing protein n=1 Tax=Paenibacillus TaxID=44249 RepID=UPI0003E2B89B|nr:MULTISPECIES: terminase large subunit [Paenibacillus]ETT49340.1 hypothetical protein C171_23745 [Paenibacillus sp. FSL H8-237]OME49552.1 hypothetical protein BSK66_26710 [Paenibacillus odorifer]